MILLADRLENRRVIEGSLGCPNCRDRFPVEDGFGDFRLPPRSGRDEVPSLEAPSSPAAVEVAALLGLAEGGGSVALIGGMAGQATALAALVPGVEFVGIAPGLRRWQEGEGVSRLDAGATLPFRSGSLRGVGLFAGGEPPIAGEQPDAREPSIAGALSMAGELARVLAPSGRIGVWGAVREWEKALRSEGLDVLASEETAVVFTRKAP